MEFKESETLNTEFVAPRPASSIYANQLPGMLCPDFLCVLSAEVLTVIFSGLKGRRPSGNIQQSFQDYR